MLEMGDFHIESLDLLGGVAAGSLGVDVCEDGEDDGDDRDGGEGGECEEQVDLVHRVCCACRRMVRERAVWNKQ